MDCPNDLIDVAVPLPIEGPFTYRISPEQREMVAFGRRVLAPFRNKIRAGFIVGVPDADAVPEKTKQVLEIPDEPPYLTPSLWDLIRWIAEYYMLDTGLVLKTALPPGSDRRSRPWAILTPEGRLQSAESDTIPDVELPRKLIKSGVMLQKDLIKLAGPEIVAEAIKRDYIRLEERIARPRTSLRNKNLPDLLNPAGSPMGPTDEPPQLTTEQAAAFHTISSALDRGGFSPFLLFGVTGSGKTEVYLRAIQETLNRSKRALVLVPEIALTPQLARRFIRRFGGGIALYHSGLTQSQRLDEWRRIQSGQVNIVIAARSGVFAPIESLGLIVVDEEHDPSYKQEDSCPYHARDMALTRAKLENACVILGSATPSFETFVNAKRGKIERLDLTQRPHGGALPTVELVDLKKLPPRDIGRAFLTGPIRRAVAETLSRGEQAVLFLNRRGFDTFAQCASCGHVFKCPNCDVTLTHHKQARAMRCHLCGYSRGAPPLCPKCSGTKLFFGGVGAQKVQEELEKEFPDARIERLDRDSTRKRSQLEDILDRFRDREIDILAGTQMIVKGHDFPGISLVGVLWGDHSLHFPDFRASERTFQMITQVSGRTGRDSDSGRVILQAFDPDHEAVRHAARHAYEEFFAGDSVLREELLYPPYGHLILIRLEGANEQRVEAKAVKIGRAARMLKMGSNDVMILGPAPSPRKKAIGKHRWQVLFKSATRAPARNLVRRLMEEGHLKGQGVKIVIDVDPIDML